MERWYRNKEGRKCVPGMYALVRYVLQKQVAFARGRTREVECPTAHKTIEITSCTHDERYEGPGVLEAG